MTTNRLPRFVFILYATMLTLQPLHAAPPPAATSAQPITPATPAAAAAPTAPAVPTAIVGPVTLTIPPGFKPAQTERNGKTLISAWTKSSRDKRVKALLQVSVYDYKAKLAKIPASDLEASAEKYLRESLSGIERRRSQYSQTSITQTTLAGAPAARATWRGQIGPMDVVGVMYSTIIQNQYVVNIQTQDLGTDPTTAMVEAMQSIEALQLSSTSQ